MSPFPRHLNNNFHGTLSNETSCHLWLLTLWHVDCLFTRDLAPVLMFQLSYTITESLKLNLLKDEYSSCLSLPICGSNSTCNLKNSPLWKSHRLGIPSLTQPCQNCYSKRKTFNHTVHSYIRSLDSTDDCHGSVVTGARVGGTGDSFAGGGGGGSIAGLSIHDGLAVTEARCSVNSDEDECQGSTFLESMSCTSRNGSITCYNTELLPHCVDQLDLEH